VAPALQAQSLEDAMVLTYTSNPTLLAARAGLRAVDESISQALSGWRPTVQGQANLAYQRSETNVTSFDTTHPHSYNFSVTQPIYSGGQTVAQTSQADNLILAQRQSLITSEQQVLLNAVTSYMGVVLAYSVLDLAISNEERLSRQLEATEDRFRVGEVTRTDVSQARARFANSQAERVQAEGDLIAQMATFEEVIGTRPANLTRPGALVGLPDSLDEALGVALDGNPAILQARASELAAQDGIDVQIADLLPDLNLVGSYTRNEDISGVISRQDNVSLVAQLTIPFYQAGFESSQIRESYQSAAQSRMLVSESLRAVEADVVSAWQGLATSRAEIAAFTEEVNANTVALEGTEREAQVGERTVLDILDAEQELFQSQINLAVAERDEVVASYTLQATLGRLTAEYLRLPVTIYNVNEYYEEARDAWWGYGGLTED
ncbi:MAG: TolC family outer membrane protein, partial [Alphaproteobacteria bacterium]